ncbi:MAG TPA: glycosyltransferase family A protein [Armatimonadota bacterium]|jgi:glycosyltransferase involved in cell wall biosynthesis
MRRPTASVIIPNYRRSQTLIEAVNSVRAQTYADHEIIVVDDASGPDFAEVYDSLLGVTVLRHNARMGPSAARNTALAAVHGEYLAFLDSDDVWLPHKLESQVRRLRERPDAALTYCHATLTDAGLTPLPSQPAPVEAGDDAFRVLLRRNVIWSSSCVMARRDAVVEAGGFDTQLQSANDWDLWLNLARAAPFVADPTPGVLYRRHGDQISGAKDAYFETDVRVREKWMQWARADAPQWLPEMRRRACRHYQRHAWTALYDCHDRKRALSALFRAIRTCPLDVRAYGRLLRATIAPLTPAYRHAAH